MKRCDCESRDAERCASARGEREECACECHGVIPQRPEVAPEHPVYTDCDPRGFVP